MVAFWRGASYLVAFAKGKGVKVEPAKAAEMYTKACDGGYVACARLGELYATGSGVSKSPDQSLALRKRACELGYMSCPGG